MNQSNKLTECQKEFLFNSRYESTEWSFGHKIPTYICDKARVNIYCEISEDKFLNLQVKDIYNAMEMVIEEMFKVCESCEYHN